MCIRDSLKQRSFCNHSKYKALAAKDGRSRHLSVTNCGMYESADDKRARELHASKKKWMTDKDLDTTQVQQRYKSSTAKSRAAWEEHPSCLHRCPWVDPSTLSCRAVDKSKHVDQGQEFQPAVRSQRDKTRDMAYRWVEEEERQDSWDWIETNAPTDGPTSSVNSAA
eukprot:TRINITY_DN4231_c0_g2_i3.p1 TRINITY_DN4231_c0_g2~~TRINITY_DN4231_c0_g2_i3.p1  ORF type:complete len:167 (+),score=44.89 TRINITY_DN4231_c0_g2_i3:147-647(+)